MIPSLFLEAITEKRFGVRIYGLYEYPYIIEDFSSIRGEPCPIFPDIFLEGFVEDVKRLTAGWGI